MSAIRFTTTLYKIGTWTIAHLPEHASEQLPSRGQVMVEGAINGFHFRAPLEPDGKWGHWLKVTKTMLSDINVGVGDTVTIVVEPTKEWPEPHIPTDLRSALEADSRAYILWKKVTPMARWEWIRWIRGTHQEATRKRRIEVALSKLKAGERRPCCWNRNLCTEPAVSKGGILLEPS
ncbi:MAG TPA: YdeI/OmpD-associated family protein [Candidatus Saccharimonadales bacterium]|nr:YdeI/OmpD-associated family protein [Candidatus Saccharimonadales bacterium]